MKANLISQSRLAYNLPKTTKLFVFGGGGLHRVIPESPRWLLHQGYVKEAEHIIRNAAKMNNVSAPAIIFTSEECLELKVAITLFTECYILQPF